MHTGDFDDQVRFRARPQVQRGPFLLDTGVLNSDTFTTGNFELAAGWGALTSQTELFVSQVNLNSGRTIHVGGAYTHLSYFLTGEHRIYEPFGQHGPQFSRNVPARNFSTKKGSEGWGQFELKARWSLLDLTEATAGSTTTLRPDSIGIGRTARELCSIGFIRLRVARPHSVLRKQIYSNAIRC